VAMPSDVRKVSDLPTAQIVVGYAQFRAQPKFSTGRSGGAQPATAHQMAEPFWVSSDGSCLYAMISPKY
jgi:hypothetical protein